MVYKVQILDAKMRRKKLPSNWYKHCKKKLILNTDKKIYFSDAFKSRLGDIVYMKSILVAFLFKFAEK